MKEITRIPLEGLHNTRDLGGFEAADGRHIRPKKLLRSGQLAGMTKKDREKSAETDMMKMLVQKMSSSETAAEEYMDGLYRDLVMEPFSRQQYRHFFEILLSHEEGALLWHCSAGKDRVGVGTALLLSALGVPRETIVRDYMMVNEFTGDVVEGHLEKLKERLHNPQLINCLRELMQVKESYIYSVFAAIDENFGGMENFLKTEMGLDGGRLELLRDKYLE